MKKLISTALVISTITLTLAGCGQKQAAVKGGVAEKTKIVVTYQPRELGSDETTPEAIFTEFEKENPDINVVIESANASDSKIMAMIAAGNPPDIIRLDAATDIPSYVTRNLLLPLDDYIKKSKVVKLEDLCEVSGMFRFDGKETGKGPLYGAAKDWGIGSQIWINKKLFNAAGIPIPSQTEPMTYAEMADYAQRLTMFDSNNKAIQIGYWSENDILNLSNIMLAQKGKSIWSEDGNTTTIMSDPDTKEAISYYYNLQKTGAMASEINPVNSWSNWFIENKIGILGFGYFVSSLIRNSEMSEEEKSNFILLPSPVIEKGQHWSAPVSACGAGIIAQSKHHDEAYKVWEYIHFGTLSDKRAVKGFGLPAVNSKFDLLPQKTEFDKATLSSVENDLKYVKNTIRVNPYVNATSLKSTVEKFYSPVLYGKETLDNSLKQIDEELKVLIDEGKEIAGVN